MENIKHSRSFSPETSQWQKGSITLSRTNNSDSFNSSPVFNQDDKKINDKSKSRSISQSLTRISSLNINQMSTLPPTTAMHWKKIEACGKAPPRPLRAHTMCMIGEKIYIFGGCDTKVCYNDLYIFDADTNWWLHNKTIGTAPPPCRAHSSTAIDDNIFIFGGGDGPTYYNVIYILNTKTLTWSQPVVEGDIPGSRRAHTMWTYNHMIYIFAGGDGAKALNDVYALSLINDKYVWSVVKTTGKPPVPRGYHTSNIVGSKVIVYGGSDGHECFNDIHILDMMTNHWTRIDADRPIPRLSHTSTQVGSYLFIIGGHDGMKYSRDVILLNLVTMNWETRKVYGVIPSGRGYHSSILYDSRIYVFGGYDGHQVFNDMFALELSACAYLPQITDFEVAEMVE